MWAVWRIRDHRLRRYLLLSAAIAITFTSIGWGDVGVAEGFHFVEYGLVAFLFYRAWWRIDDASVIVLPLLAGVVVGSIDEWFQWFIPIRAGEARDIGLDCIATMCGILFAAALLPPGSLTRLNRPDSLHRLALWSTAACVAFATFFLVVHLGYEVTDPAIGSFRSRYCGRELEQAARDRAERWRHDPPVVLRRVSREDQYLTEGRWRVGRRNEAWNAGDVTTAWHENQILETFYGPVLDAPTYGDPSPQRWSSEQRDDARARADALPGQYRSTAYPYPLYVWPRIVSGC